MISLVNEHSPPHANKMIFPDASHQSLREKASKISADTLQ